MNDDSRLAGILVAYRQAYGLSQSALAELLGVDQSYISKIERGRGATIARAKITLGTALGDVLPQDRLPEATKQLTEALEIVEHLEKSGHKNSPAVKTELLKKMGNALRKQGCYSDAGDFLKRSLALEFDDASRGSAALCLARPRANQRDERAFAKART